MRICIFLAIVFLTVAEGKRRNHNHHHHHLTEELVEPVIPKLTERQRKALIKFENPAAFQTAWNVAKRKVQHRIENLRKNKGHHHSYIEQSGEDVNFD